MEEFKEQELARLWKAEQQWRNERAVCCNCRFAVRDSDGAYECRRHAPVVRLSKDDQPIPYARLVQPVVGSDYFCGDFERKAVSRD